MTLLLLLKITLILGSFIFFSLKKLPLFISLFLSTLFLGILFLSPGEILMGLFKGLTGVDTLSLIFLIWITVSFTKLIDIGGGIKGSSNILMKSVSNPVLLFPFFPSLIGLFPMPGGALVSAPMLERMAKGSGMSGSEQAAMNFWFRHVWESVWPLYPSIILSAGLLDTEFSTIISHQYFLAISAITGGFLFMILPAAKKLKAAAGNKEPFPVFKFMGHLWPIMVLIVGILFGKFTLPHLRNFFHFIMSGNVPHVFNQLMQFLYMAILILLISFVYIIQKKLSSGQVITSIKEGFAPKLIFLIPVIFTFKYYVEHTGITEAMERLSNLPYIPPEAIIFVIPLILGLLFGIAIAFISVGIPLLLPMLLQNGSVNWSYFALFFLGGYIGILFSPMHLCLLVSKEYFNGSLIKMYGKMILPGIFLLFAGIILNILIN